MATLKRPPHGRIIKPPVKGRRGQLTTLPAIQVSGKGFTGRANHDNTTTTTSSPMSHDGFKSQKVRAKQTVAEYLPQYYLGEHAPIHSSASPQPADTNSLRQEPVPYRFSFRKSEESLEALPNNVWPSSVVLVPDRDSMFSRERSYVLSTPFQGTRHSLDKEKLSELQIIVGDPTEQDKPVKRRLLRKPLPFSHYKKSQKVRIIHPIEYGYESSQDSLKLTLLGQQKSDTAQHDDPNSEEEVKKQSKKLVTTWLKQIDRKLETADDPAESRYLSHDATDREVGVDKDSIEKSLQDKQSRRMHQIKKSGRLLPYITSMSPQSKMSPQLLEFHRQTDPEEEDKYDMDDQHPETPLNLPALPTKDTVAVEASDHVLVSDNKENEQPEETKSYQQEYESEHLPSILLHTLDNTEELERERLKLIHLDKHSLEMTNALPHSIQSEPCYPSFAMNTFYSKGTSSRSIAHKPKSLRDMASAFKSRMGFPVASPTHCGDRMWKDRISNYSSTVIHHETYDHFARQKFPKTKPASNTGHPSADSSSCETRQHVATFSNSYGTFRKPVYERNTSARSLSEDSGRSKLSKSTEQLTKIKLKTREFSNASLHSLSSSLKSDRNSGVFRGRKLSNPSLDPDTTRSRKLYRSDSNVSLNSIKGGSKKGSSKLKRRGSKQRGIGIGVNE